MSAIHRLGTLFLQGEKTIAVQIICIYLTGKFTACRKKTKHMQVLTDKSIYSLAKARVLKISKHLVWKVRFFWYVHIRNPNIVS